MMFEMVNRFISMGRDRLLCILYPKQFIVKVVFIKKYAFSCYFV